MPLKVKIFLWLVKRNRVLTKLNLAKSGWSASTKYIFSDLEEFTDHLFISCPLVNKIWQ
jgi:zinc-binding in reverse transcriptase